MSDADFKAQLKQQLPDLLRQDAEMRALILQTVENYFANRQETESRFDRVLAQMERDRNEEARRWDEQSRRWAEQDQKWHETLAQLALKWKEQDRKWDEDNQRWAEQNQKWHETLAQLALKWEEQDRKWDEDNQRWAEQNQKWHETLAQLALKWEEQDRKWDEQDRKWDEQNRKWDEQNRKWDENARRQDEMLAEIKAMNRKHESTIGALGARWGLYTEQSFRNALKGILEESFGVEVVKVVEYDDAGEVFGRPDQVDLDLLIRNGDLIICEIKSSISKPDLYAFDRKISFYEKRHQRSATRRIVISPMVHPTAQPIASRLGMELYSYADDVPMILDDV